MAWDDDIASVPIADHQAVSLLPQLKCDEQTEAGIDTVLISLPRTLIVDLTSKPASYSVQTTFVELSKGQGANMPPVR